MMDYQPTKEAQVGYGTTNNSFTTWTPSMVPILASPQYPQMAYHRQLQAFWSNQMQEIEQTVDFKAHSFPLARIKKIMKADEDVKMISAEVPVVFAKACEMFILEFTLRSWMHTVENKRRTLQKNDIAAAIGRTDIFDFLVDIVRRDDFKKYGAGMIIPRRAIAAMPLEGTTPVAGVENVPPYYYVAQTSTQERYVPPHPPIQQMWPSTAPTSASSSSHNIT